jgi:hypothetical protein
MIGSVLPTSLRELEGERTMQLSACIIGSIGALAMSAMTIAAQAAPAGGATPLRADTANVEKAAATCWWRHGKRRCAYGYRVYGYPEYYRTGTRRWWTEMDREGRGGRGRR